MSSDSDKKSLTIKRGQLKTQLTKFANYLASVDKSKVTEIKVRLEKIETLLDKFDAIQSQLEFLNEDDTSADAKMQRDVLAQERDDFENAYYSAVTLARDIIASTMTSANDSNEQMQTAVRASATLAPSDNSQPNSFRLPAVNLPEFGGEYHKWLQFSETFTSLIGNNNHLTEIQKLYYLQGCLKGEARQVLQSLDVTGQNFVVAWELLKKRFENKRVIVEKHVQALFDIPEITRESNLALRNLLDAFETHTRSLKSLGEPVDTWDTLLVHLLKSKLDFITKREWQENSIAKNDKRLPSLKDFTEFLSKRCQLLETLDAAGNKTRMRNNAGADNKRTLIAVSANKFSCYFCNGNHSIYKCKRFLSLNVKVRVKEIKRLKLCENCLRPEHSAKECSNSGCRKCNQKHNSLLYCNHSSDSEASSNEQRNQASDDLTKSATSVVAHSTRDIKAEIILSTAIVYLIGKDGTLHRCRALLDSGSQSNFICKSIVNKLNLNACDVNVPISGINQTTTYVSKQVHATVQSLHNNFQAKLTFLVLDKITENIPSCDLDVSKISIPNNITLADPEFYRTHEIDILLGASIFWDLLCIGQIKLGNNQPTLQKSKFGWIIAGSFMSSNSSFSKSLRCNTAINMQAIQDKLETFWKLEELPDKSPLSQEEAACERNFVKSFKRDDSNRFVVSLPFKDNAGQLGDNLENATKRFNALERRLSKNSEIREEYSKFMSEYEALGHMSLISDPSETDCDRGIYYLPHHCVIKEDSSTTKLRVVFDASSKSDNGISLNDILMVGPTIQEDLLSILLRFREHGYVIAGDIAKMYRQINLIENERDLQRILWRTDPDKEIKHFRLNTVTYGTASASFLSTRCLHQVAIENKASYPVASNAIIRDFYVDDVLTGASSIEDAIQLKHDLTNILGQSGFELRKWISNNHSILEADCTQISETDNYYINDDSKNAKTLGLYWNAVNDFLRYRVRNTELKSNRVSKRSILSTIAQIFDPLSLIGPVTIKAKLILQRLWRLNISWDESVPVDLYTSWKEFVLQMSKLNDIEIPRHVLCVKPIGIQLHGYCDASEVAYGACLYLRSVDENGQVHVHLLCAKSRVAPLKSISLPRLELCGALLLAQLTRKALNSILSKVEEVFLWCDSKIVLAWIAAQPCTWTTFVANRVTQIQELTHDCNWKHVNSIYNPADIISRGVEPSRISDLNLWWHGPAWLAQHQEHWPQGNIDISSDPPERKRIKMIFKANVLDQTIFERYSSLYKLQRVVAYCFRFCKNASKKNSVSREIGSLTVDELDHALTALLKVAQSQDFNRELAALKESQGLPKDSKLLALDPYLDERQLIRVGGRLRHAEITHDRKFPVVLFPKHPLTKLIILNEHHRNLHAGAQAILAILRLRYWPLNGRETVRSVLRKCVVCFRVKPFDISPKMGNLPRSRVIQNRPFSVVGIDFAGPLNIKDGKTRNRRLVKAYICAFVCFSVKAVHLEIVSDLSSESFLNCLKRFVSRRGICREIYSDNGTNFVGANNDLKQVFDSFSNSTKDDNFLHYLAKNSIKWHFIPSRSPHFGGIWESVIKSTKFHLKRVLGNSALTFEELYTVITQIEAILNSRPLVPLSSDPSDLTALTPGHFIIGESLSAIPQHDVRYVAEIRLNKYERLQKMLQHFWTRWSQEYLATLHQRQKWKAGESPKLQPGMMVILKDDNSHPLNWKLGRISEIHPGPDNIVRVASVKCANGAIVRRAVRKLCVLPLYDEQ